MRSRRRSRPPAKRLVAMLVAMTLGLGGILLRLVVLQVKDASAYQALARQQRVRTIDLPAQRGAIFDRDGKELAMSLPAKAVYADPALVRSPVTESQAVAAALLLDPATVYKKLTTRRTAGGTPNRFVYLARGVDLRTANALALQNLPGIGFLAESRRYYPAGAMAPQVLGFVGLEGTGLTGLEYQYQRVLAGHPGRSVVEEDPSGTLIPQAAGLNVPPVPGDDLMLTLDSAVQYRAQTSLAKAVRANHAKGGTVIVMNPDTGEILAMATYPWFDPNDFGEAAPDDLRNRAVTDAYEPGSVNKVITACAAVQEGALKLNQRLSIPDQYQLYDRVYHDSHTHATEEMTLGDIIAYSSNIGAIKVAAMLGKYRFASYLYSFGFGQKTGVGFPGESPGILTRPKKWSGVDIASIPIGQGIAVTPLQMASVYATVANGGVWVQPRLVRGTVDADGELHPSTPPRTRTVISARSARIVTRMLAYAVEVGTGQEAQIPGFWVAGKTGTARKPLVGALGYSTKYVASFIGFAPASRPSLVVAAVIDEPATVFGGIAAAPLFKDVARFALARFRIPPAAKPPIPPHAVPVSRG